MITVVVIIHLPTRAKSIQFIRYDLIRHMLILSSDLPYIKFENTTWKICVIKFQKAQTMPISMLFEYRYILFFVKQVNEIENK